MSRSTASKAVRMLRNISAVKSKPSRSLGSVTPPLVSSRRSCSTRYAASSASTLLASSPWRPFSTSISPCAALKNVSSSSSSSSSSGSTSPKPTGPLRDEAIFTQSSRHRASAGPSTTEQDPDEQDSSSSPEIRFVRLVDPKTGALAGPFDLRQILAKLDRSKFWIQQVVPPAPPSRITHYYDPESPSSSSQNVDVASLVQFPICKLIDKKEEFDKQRALKRKAQSQNSAATSNNDPNHTSSSASTSSVSSSSSSSGGSKEVQLTWSVTPNDLKHKLSKAKTQMLNKGSRINVVITTKSGGRRYVKGLDPKEDAKRQQLLVLIEKFLCQEESHSQQGEQDDGENNGANSLPSLLEHPNLAQIVVARRLQDIDWQRGGSAAVMSFERIRR